MPTMLKIAIRALLSLAGTYFIMSAGIWFIEYEHHVAIGVMDIIFAVRGHGFAYIPIMWSSIIGIGCFILALMGKYRKYALIYVLPFFMAWIVAHSGIWLNDPEGRGDITLLLNFWPDSIHIKSLLALPASVIFPVVIALMLLIGYFSTLTRPKDKYGSAKWASKADLKEMGLNTEKGIVLGKIGADFIRSDSPLSALVLAPPGTGKTAAIVIPNLLLIKHSVLVYDIKGELFQCTAKARTKFSNVLIFDPYDPGSMQFNVFAKDALPADSLDYKSYIGQIATILFKTTGNATADFFILEARNAFIFFAYWQLVKKGATSLPSILRHILAKEEIRETIVAMLQEVEPDSIVAALGRSVLTNVPAEEKSTNNQFIGVVTTLKQRLDVFHDPRIEAITSNNCSIYPADLRKIPTSIYLRVRERDKISLAPLISLLFEYFSSQLLSELPGKNDIPVTFIMDEFVRLGKMQTIEDMPAVSRGYGLNAIFIAQDFAQIEAVYGQGAAQIFHSNCAYKVILQQNSIQTAKNISETIGNQTTLRISENEKISKLINSDRSRGISEEGVPLLSPQDVMNINKGECRILVQGFLKHPLKAQLPYWFKDRKLNIIWAL